MYQTTQMEHAFKLLGIDINSPALWTCFGIILVLGLLVIIRKKKD